MLSFKEFVDKLNETHREPIKVNFDMIKRVVENGGAIAILTAYRGTLDDEGSPIFSGTDNQARNRKLKNEISMNGFELTDVNGVYVEGKNTPNEREVSEKSILVWSYTKEQNKKLKKLVIKLGQKYNQDAILFAENGKGMLIGTASRDELGRPIDFPGKGKVVNVGTLKKGRGEFYTMLKSGESFKFE